MKRYGQGIPPVEVFNKLSEGHRLVIVGYHIFGNYKESADDLGINIGTFKSRLNRARKLIKKYEEENVQSGM